MKIVPPSLNPWRTTIDRQHEPPPRRGRYGYRHYRPCLRWEFGFTCAFCLCHESDFSPQGTEGLGITQIEHQVPVSRDEEGVNEYTNCFYICRLCNGARSAKPNFDPQSGRRLLDPCRDVWDEAFVLSGDEIKPRDGSGDAAYTHEAYDLNDPYKVGMRRYRRETIRERLEVLEREPALHERLLEKARTSGDPEFIEMAHELEGGLRRAWRDLGLFPAIPRDAPCPCECGDDSLCRIPPVLEEQALEIEAPFTNLG